MIIDPSKDGIDHINVYAMGKTEFGRFFSNMTNAPVSLPYLGKFRTIEGLWYYLGNPNEEYRELSGFEVKALGKTSPRTQDLPEEIFQYIIRSAILRKARKYGGIDLCTDPKNQLPLLHYYVYGKNHPNPKIVDITSKFQWWLDIIEDIRKKSND